MVFIILILSIRKERLLFYFIELTLFIVLKEKLSYYYILWEYFYYCINSDNKIKLIIILFYSVEKIIFRK